MNTKSLIDELRSRRSARAARRTLEHELSSYTRPVDVDDLLAALHPHDGADVEEIRSILVRNQVRHSLHRAS